MTDPDRPGGLRAEQPLAPRPSVATTRTPHPPNARRKSPLRWVGRFAGLVLGLVALVAIVGGLVGYGAYRHFAADLPDVDGLRHYQPRVMSRVYAGDSRLMAELATERRIFVPYAAIPELVRRAFVSAEDQNFWLHHGVDPMAILRAAVTDLHQMGQGRRPVGASTITQQVAKNMLLGNELSLARKAKEAILALRIEETLPKERILELYLNEIYLGQQAYGVAAAAQAYFNKPLDELTLPEAAFLAALPKAPNNYNPFRFPDAAQARRDWVIDRMAEDHVVTAAEAADAKARPVTPAAFHRPEALPGADWFAEEVRRQLVEKFGADATTQGGLVVRTSLDPALQRVAETTLRDGLMAYDRSHGFWHGPVAHLDAAPSLRTEWASALGKVAAPPGMLANWRLAVVLDIADTQARLGWLDRNAADPLAPAQPKVGPMLLADLGWARAVRDGKPGPGPKRVGDVVQPGDVVMAEPAAATSGPASSKEARPDRLLLRQIPKVQGAMVSLDPTTGRVLALVGGWSFDQSQFNRATQANRQPGSSFKPFVYLTALEMNIPPNQRFLDAPFVVNRGAEGKWRPNNYEMDFNGPVPLRIALEKSLNLVTLRVANTVGMDAIARNAIAFGVVDNMPRVLPAALGAVETTVLRMAGGYGSLSQEGRQVTPSLIDSVQDRDGNLVWHAPGLVCEKCDDPATPPTLTDQRQQIADPASTFQIVTMMQGVVRRGTGVKAAAGLDRQIAGKTGTTQDFNDAWFAGFTPDLVTVVWIGFDTPITLGENETGGAIAAPVWHDFMARALKDRPNLTFPQPDGVVMVKWDTGFGSVTDAFKPGTEPGSQGGAGAFAGDAPASTAAPGAAAGVDTTMGGLY